MQFRKRPVVITAMQWDGSTQSGEAIAAAMPGVHCHAEKDDPRPPRLSVATLEGVMTACAGDWIIRGIAGEVYPCRSDVFAVTYEPVGGVDNAAPEQGPDPIQKCIPTEFGVKQMCPNMATVGTSTHLKNGLYVYKRLIAQGDDTHVTTRTVYIPLLGSSPLRFCPWCGASLIEDQT